MYSTSPKSMLTTLQYYSKKNN